MRKYDIPLDECTPSKYGICKVTECGHITEIMELERKNTGCATRKLNADLYMLVATGEVKEYNKTTDRAENSAAKSRFAASMKALRDLINCNCTEPVNCRWMTFTYAENMTDTKRLYDDRRKFWQKVQRWHKRNNLPVPEYITICEPQGRGAWHLHELWMYPKKAPYLPNETIRELWQQGFVTVKKLENVDNIGAYLTAYLCDVPLEEAAENGIDIAGCKLKEAQITAEDGSKVSKKYIKGARLNLYPSGMNFYRCSRGVKRPLVEWTSVKTAKEKVSGATLTYSSAIRLVSDDGAFSNDIKYEYYNAIRTESQPVMHTTDGHQGNEVTHETR